MNNRFEKMSIKEFVSKPLFDEIIVLKKDPSVPKISIVTTSYNQGEFIGRTILSVLNQNYPNLEYIIIDGGSNDNSIEIIKKYEKFLSYWVSESDNGQSSALKKGSDKSTGDIMAFLSSDDTYCPGVLNKIADLFKRNPEVDVIYGAINLVDSHDNILVRRDMSGSRFDFSILLFDSSLPQQAVFWRRDIYLKSGGIDSSFLFSMDKDLWVRFSLSGAKFLRVNEVLANFRLHGSNKTLTINDIRIKEDLLIVERTLGRRIGPFELWFRVLVNKTKRYLSNPLDLFRGLVLRIRRLKW
ncbi:MAG TPA: glycosyltransferase family 2 protein [Caldisericia bacterium]|nr:glycosyltransferase family 2 protein [Caldisericia bacterium]